MRPGTTIFCTNMSSVCTIPFALPGIKGSTSLISNSTDDVIAAADAESMFASDTIYILS